MKKVFISYVRENANQVGQICQAFIENDIPYWLDTRDIPPGTPWPNAIENAINDGGFFFSVFFQRVLV